MTCPICGGTEKHLGDIPFDRNLFNVPIVYTTPMAYYICDVCEYISCPEMLAWSSTKFSTDIYNEDYIKYDPDYLGPRAASVASSLLNSIHPLKTQKLNHLDYGSGCGRLSEILEANNIKSTSYDPYSDTKVISGKFNFITAVEVFEHSSNIRATLSDIKSKLSSDGVVLFTTLLGNKNTSIEWDYLLPRNGHISILSEKSIKFLAKEVGLFFSSINYNYHILQPSRSNLKGILGW